MSNTSEALASAPGMQTQTHTHVCKHAHKHYSELYESIPVLSVGSQFLPYTSATDHDSFMGGVEVEEMSCDFVMQYRAGTFGSFTSP